MLFRSLNRVRGGPDGFSDRQDPGIVQFILVLHSSQTNRNVEAPLAIEPVFHTHPPSQMHLVQMHRHHRRHVHVERGGFVQLV